MKIVSICPICQKKGVEEVSLKTLGKIAFHKLDCGHTYASRILEKSTINKITLKDGRELYPFQVDGERFLEASNFRGLIADEMGLGKTVQAVASLKLHSEILLPALAIVKASLTVQWAKEIYSGAGLAPQILTTKEEPIPGFPVYITSFDSLPPRTKKGSNGKETTNGLVGKIKTLGIKTLIIDECQMMKNHDSNRTNAIRELTRSSGTEASSIQYIIALSGTPIKNNAIEYFPILNLLHPERFPNRQRFIDRDCAYYYSSSGSYKPAGLKYPEEFQERNKDFIIRRTRKEVLPDLPSIQRDYRLFEMGEVVTKAYNNQVKALASFLDDPDSGTRTGFETQTGILGYLNKLRHITGLAKIEPTIEYLDEFLSYNQGEEKITVFHHHIDAGDILEQKLDELYPGAVVRIVSSDDSGVRGEKIEQFKTLPEKRVLIAPTLACGEGINLQFCSHAIIMEREWNPANEEQAEGRFSRIGSTADKILVNYPTGTGTIDEFLSEMVERKRQYVSETLDGSAQKWEESDIIRELANKVVTKWRSL